MRHHLGHCFITEIKFVDIMKLHLFINGTQSMRDKFNVIIHNKFFVILRVNSPKLSTYLHEMLKMDDNSIS